jgi:hypothetical protein
MAELQQRQLVVTVLPLSDDVPLAAFCQTLSASLSLITRARYPTQHILLRTLPSTH